MLQRKKTPGFPGANLVMAPPQHQQGGQARHANRVLTAVRLPTALVRAQSPPRLQLPGPQRDRPAFLGDAPHWTRRPLGQSGPQALGRRRAHVPPLVAPDPSDVTPLTQTPAGTLRPKRLAALPPRRSGPSGAVGVWVRHLGHELVQRFILTGLPGTRERQDQAPAPCGSGRGTGCDHGAVSLGTLGGLPAHDAQLGPRGGHHRVHHLAPHPMVTALMGMARGPDEAQAHGPPIALPRRPQHDEAHAKQPGRLLTETPCRPDRRLRAAWVRMPAVAQQRPHAMGRRRQGAQASLGHPADAQMPVPRGGFQQAPKAPRRARGGRPPGPLGPGVSPGGPRLPQDQPAAKEAMATTPHGGQAAQHPGHTTREGGEGHHPTQRHLQRGDEAQSRRWQAALRLDTLQL
jgi:hypothetical protein